jgi:DNA-binding response OmpR family regulator
MSRRILVVEDHHDTSFTLCRLLKLEGYEVDHAIDGVAGFSTASSLHPDLIVTDLQMPRMNGIEMIREIRKDFGLNGTPILVMSAYGRRTLDEAMEAGANGFIEKPLDFDNLLIKVREALPAA